MENRLSENVASNVVVSGGVKLKKKRPKNIYGVDSSEEKLDQEFGGEPLDLDLIPGHDNSPDRNGVERPPFVPNDDEEVHDYERSRYVVKQRIEQSFSNDVGDLDQQNTDIIVELNKRLVELDRINEDKRDL